MSARRGASGLSGILAVDKPGGITSHDVVHSIRRITGEKRVGHAGTLDPMATGLLVVMVGPATRLAPFLTAADKTYLAKVSFGAETESDDAEGRIIRTAHVPDEVCDPIFAAGTCASLVGSHLQTPPAFSAIKKQGAVAHKAARAGTALELEPRPIRIVSCAVVGIECSNEIAWDLELTVSKGTYVRALARDIGRALDSAAHLSSLRRTRSGVLDVASAYILEEIEAAADVTALFIDPVTALGIPVIRTQGETAQKVANGSAIESASSTTGEPIAVVAGDRLLAVYESNGSGAARALAVIPGGVSGVMG